MNLRDQIQFSDSIQAISLSPDGDRIAIVVGEGDDTPYSFAESRRDQTLHLYRLMHGRLEPETTFTLSPAPQWQADSRPIHFRYKGFPARVLFRDARTVFIARGTQPIYADPELRFRLGFNAAEAFAIDLETGQERGRYFNPDESYTFGLALAPPRHVLLGLQKTVVCLEADSLREVCLAREIDEEGDPVEEDAIPEESLAVDGIAYDPVRDLLFMQCSYFIDV